MVSRPLGHGQREGRGRGKEGNERRGAARHADRLISDSGGANFLAPCIYRAQFDFFRTLFWGINFDLTQYLCCNHGGTIGLKVVKCSATPDVTFLHDGWLNPPSLQLGEVEGAGVHSGRPVSPLLRSKVRSDPASSWVLK